MRLIIRTGKHSAVSLGFWGMVLYGFGWLMILPLVIVVKLVGWIIGEAARSRAS